ncbi:General stress protein 16O [Gemmata sp. SH-PL17]|uniref:TraR/DksA family transcriptional regulator n=1 Tax=Gemmata sp. SH-PL17 TaxID=1630693 RepID=UPI0004AF9697|nr:TraR/DksA family transcriptional regulator [Gemmata sp. SH-PL17]AMV30124.1 General stress protein 16O [Gemmata sp. SH-PL17]
MNKQQLDRYRKLLGELVDRVGATAASLEAEVRVPLGGESGGGVSNAPMHLADLGTGTFSQELDATLLENETYIRDEAVAALDRIEQGTYGRCQECKRDIGAARLGALPYARHCVACAEMLQSGRAVNVNDGRPAEWLGEPGHESRTEKPQRVVGRDLGADSSDTHAAGTPGGGAAVGGLAGTTVGSGAINNAALQGAMGSGPLDEDETPDEEELPAEAGAAVGGTPANKRLAAKTSKRTPPKPPARRAKRG